MLKQTFETLLHSYTNDQRLIDESVKDYINDWNIILFALFYHDVIYKATKSNNEEQSAVFAGERMKKLSVPDEKILCCKNQILATKSHLQQLDSDTNYFTDADLSVLGKDWNTYEVYFKQVRMEYAIYPDFLYNPGRKKVLTHFLTMDRIFKTDYFFDKHEVKAKNNLKKELETFEGQ